LNPAVGIGAAIRGERINQQQRVLEEEYSLFCIVGNLEEGRPLIS
jgi:hypothetical protein